MRNKLIVFKQKLKDCLRKNGILHIVATLNNPRWAIRHMKCNIMKKKRMRGYYDKKFSKIKSYAHKHDGERCFIVCTGPSLTLDDVNMLKGEYTFSMNSIVKWFDKTDWRPTYYMIQDPVVYSKLEADLMRYEIKNCFMADFISSLGNKLQNSIIYPFDLLNHSEGIHFHLKYFFSENAYGMVYNGGTVAYSAIQLAVYMGFKEIYLLGCDCNYSGEKVHCAEYGESYLGRSVAMEKEMLDAYRVAKQYADNHEIQIYNATRGGKLEVFERVDFDEVIKRKGRGD